MAVIPMLGDQNAAGDALCVLTALAPLLELGSIDGGVGGYVDASDDDSSEQAVEDRQTQTAGRLSSLLFAMEGSLANASRAVSPNGVDDALPKGESPGFFPALAMAAVLVSAAGPVVSKQAQVLGGVPPRLVERLAHAAIDELLAAAVPGLRAASLAALDTLGDIRPPAKVRIGHFPNPNTVRPYKTDTFFVWYQSPPRKPRTSGYSPPSAPRRTTRRKPRTERRTTPPLWRPPRSPRLTIWHQTKRNLSPRGLSRRC